jgi:membrane-bound inhibitor of C-type lysozyme
MILSEMGRGFSSWSTSANSCSGPKTSSGLYVWDASVYLALAWNANMAVVNLKYNCTNNAFQLTLVYHDRVGRFKHRPNQ